MRFLSPSEVDVPCEAMAPKTRAGRRTVPMSDTVAGALQRHLAEFVADDPAALVFGGAGGGVLRAGSWRSRFWRPAIREACLDGVRIHDLRHTAVSLWIAARADPKQIASWAGHMTTSVVLDRYGHLYEGNDADVLARLDSFARMGTGDVPSPWIPRVFRGFPEGPDPESTEPQAADLGKRGGRNRTRTCDLCRVKAAL